MATTTYDLSGCCPQCANGCCGGGGSTISVAVAGLTNHTCSLCASFNTTFSGIPFDQESSGTCFWFKDYATGNCGMDKVSVSIHKTTGAAGVTISGTGVGIIARFTGTIGATPIDCTTGGVLNGLGGDPCNAGAATATLSF